MKALSASVKNKKDHPKTPDEQLEAELAEAKQLVESHPVKSPNVSRFEMDRNAPGSTPKVINFVGHNVVKMDYRQ